MMIRSNPSGFELGVDTNAVSETEKPRPNPGFMAERGQLRRLSHRKQCLSRLFELRGLAGVAAFEQPCQTRPAAQAQAPGYPRHRKGRSSPGVDGPVPTWPDHPWAGSPDPTPSSPGAPDPARLTAKSMHSPTGLGAGFPKGA